jgi:hypothetical protein
VATAIFQAQLFLSHHPSTQITIFSTNPAAIQAITNLGLMRANFSLTSFAQL